MRPIWKICFLLPNLEKKDINVNSLMHQNLPSRYIQRFSQLKRIPLKQHVKFHSIQQDHPKNKVCTIIEKRIKTS